MTKARKMFEVLVKRAIETNKVFYISLTECSMNCRKNIEKIIREEIANRVLTDTQDEIDKKLAVYQIILKSLKYRVG